jgi:hypothetical protein
MFDEDYELVSGFADVQRSSMAIGVGNIIGGKYTKLQQILRAKFLTPKEKFLEAIQLVCYTEGIGYEERTYNKIATLHPYPQYLNPKACVYVVSNTLTPNNKINVDKVKASTEFQPLDIYRYSVLIAGLLREKE